LSDGSVVGGALTLSKRRVLHMESTYLRVSRRMRRLSAGTLPLLFLVVALGCEARPAPAPDVVGTAAVTAHGEAHRPSVTGTTGLVAANHPLAAAAGFEVLLAGGNAVDAAIATGAALGVVEPFNSGVGGVGWMNIYWAETGTVHILNFSGRSPAALTAEHFAGEPEIPARGPLSMLVPGSPSGWARAQERFGTMTASRLLEAAIRLAEEGYSITTFGAEQHANARELFLDWDEGGARTWWGGRREAPEPGALVRVPELAEVYRSMADRGFESFYQGDTPREISNFVQSFGGVLTPEDFARYEAEWEEPLHVRYRGFDIYNAAPSSSGGLAILQILKILEGFDLVEMGLNSADYVHHVVEAVKLAAADRAAWVGDPALMDAHIPLDDLLSDVYAAQQRARIDARHASTEVRPSDLLQGTTHYSIVDSAGNLVSVTTTMGSGFGSGMVGGGTGVFLNNGVRWFELDPGSPAVVAGNKHTRWNMGPTLIGRNGVPFIAMGTPGGGGIWQTQSQVITKLLDFGMDPQNAIESPRFRWELSGVDVSVEGRIPPTVVAELERRGHAIRVLPDWTSAVGGMNAVKLDRDTGQMWGGADPRRDGYVVGW